MTRATFTPRMSLEFEVSVPDAAGDGTPIVVLLHGRGSDRFDLMGLRDELAPAAVIVTPQAPFPAAPWGYGAGWAWYRYVGEDRPDPETFSRSQERLGEFLGELPERLPIRPGPIALGGFSQGGTMSLAHALLQNGRVGYVLNFSGFLANHPQVRAGPDTVRGIRIFWGHGRRDPAIPFQLAEKGRHALRNAGADLESRDYDIGHWIDPQELTDARSWLEAGFNGGNEGPGVG